ncbi:MAG TPA: peptidoglycan DD-metalloendopeptidase family protein [Bacteroidota bacterium]|nr:peptidoglycan DD-metalloendopeptidase family protein [Bacteroidota bacterium]
MSPENVRERKQKRRYTFIVVPDAKSQETRTVSASLLTLIATVLAVLIVVVASILAIIIYTPVGIHLPISNPELTRQYGRQLAGIQTQIRGLMEEVSTLREYNVKLRKAMGEDVAGKDTVQNAGSPDSSIALPPLSDEATGQEAHDVQEVSPRTGGQVATVFQPEHGSGLRQEMLKQFPLTMPASGFVSGVFQPERSHYGIDVAGKLGSPVVSGADGTIVFAGWTPDDGFTIMVAHDNGFITVYKHNASLLKSAGENVHRGEMIALLGNTGRTSSGPHLHFEVWKDGIAEDPNNYLLSNP